MITLVPLTQAEYLAFAEAAVPLFAEEKIASGQWSRDEALALSRKSLEDLLPHGLQTPGHFLFGLHDPAEPASVGVMWIAAEDRAGKSIAYVYDVSIKPAFRRKGHATRAFLALEKEVRSLGLSGIALNVFGHNAAARALYAKLGYQPTSIQMFKPLGKPGA